MFKGKHVQQQWSIPDETSEYLYTPSKLIYTLDDIGPGWLRNVFVPEITFTIEEGEYYLLVQWMVLYFCLIPIFKDTCYYRFITLEPYRALISS